MDSYQSDLCRDSSFRDGTEQGVAYKQDSAQAFIFASSISGFALHPDQSSAGADTFFGEHTGSMDKVLRFHMSSLVYGASSGVNSGYVGRSTPCHSLIEGYYKPLSGSAPFFPISTGR